MVFVSSEFAVNSNTLYAMGVLYLILAVASTGVSLWTTPPSQLRQQVNSWWLLFPIVSLSLLWYRVGPILLTLLIAGLAERELALHYAAPRWRFRLLCVVLMLVLAGLALVGDGSAAAILPWLVVLQGLHFALRRQRSQLLLLLFLLLCFGLNFVPRLLSLPLSPQVLSAWLFYLFALTALNDIAQFIIGKTLGRHKVAARVSPNKTWQGLLGGIAISTLVSVVMGQYLQLATTDHLIALALLLSIGGFVGDLSFSAAKRYLGIKDFSQLIPGHGGILDRVDSLVLTAPLLYCGLRAVGA